MKVLDARHLACPQPVIELRKRLDAGDREVRVLVADELSRSNVERFARSRGASVSTAPAADRGFAIEVTAHADGPGPDGDAEIVCAPPEPAAGAGPVAIQISSATMGHGDDDLGALLLRSFVKTQLQLEARPDLMVFYNSGVRLCCEGSPLVDDLAALAAEGTEILACGTCLNYFELGPTLRVGRVCDMLEIATRLAGAGRVVRP